MLLTQLFSIFWNETTYVVQALFLLKSRTVFYFYFIIQSALWPADCYSELAVFARPLLCTARRLFYNSNTGSERVCSVQRHHKHRRVNKLSSGHVTQNTCAIKVTLCTWSTLYTSSISAVPNQYDVLSFLQFGTTHFNVSPFALVLDNCIELVSFHSSILAYYCDSVFS